MEDFIVLSSLEELPRVARQIVQFMGNSRFVAFYGSMGSGKTTLIKEICHQLGVENVVTSPTFALVNEYVSTESKIFHFDLYRINKIEELYDIGYEEYFYSGRYCFVEWPELAESLLPEDIVRLVISATDDGKRFITLSKD